MWKGIKKEYEYEIIIPSVTYQRMLTFPQLWYRDSDNVNSVCMIGRNYCKD